MLLLLPALGGCQRSRPAAKPSEPASRPAPAPSCTPPGGPVSGRITADTRWCGAVAVTGNILVPKGVTLTVHPGTTVRFTPYRGYEQPQRRLRLRVEGRLLAEGKPGALIRFTSGHKQPRNGDWSMVKLVSANGSRISHAVFEYAQHGLNIWNTDIALSRLVVRFNNWEGLYAENHCAVSLAHSRIYGNGYNCVAVEQFVTLNISNSYIANCGTSGVHVDASKATIEDSLVEGSGESVTLDNDATITLLRNRFCGPEVGAVSCGEGKLRVRRAGNVVDGVPRQYAWGCDEEQLEDLTPEGETAEGFVSGVAEGRASHQGYTPADPTNDRYPYVYAAKDATRRVVRRLGGGLGLTWSVAWDGKALWTATLDGKVMRLDADSGKVTASFRAPGPQPWGMTHDGKLLWINDFARRHIFGLNPKDGKVMRQFPAPDPAGGCKGLTHDGKRLHALGWATHKLYELDEDGSVLSAVAVPWRELGGGVRLYAAGGLAFDGEQFWAPADRLLRFDRQGKLSGWVHATSERVWGMAHDGEALWTTQRANENWHDYPRLFRVKLLAVQQPEQADQNVTQGKQ